MSSDLWTRLAWLALVAVHVPPALPLLAPAALERLYGVRPGGDLALLLTHRAALFAAIVVLAAWAALDAGVRRAASVTVAVSVCGFLVLYVAAGAPAGPLRRVAVVDALALGPLAWVLASAWRP
jgi:hypothetical protein